MADLSDQIEAFVQKVQNISSLGASFVYDVGKLLVCLGYTTQDGDDWLLGFCISKVDEEIKSACNVSIIPDGLKKAAAEVMVGEFLNMKKGMGQLQGFAVDLSMIEKQIEEGDTNIVYAVGQGAAQTPEQQLDNLIVTLMNTGRKQYASYRRLAW